MTDLETVYRARFNSLLLSLAARLETHLQAHVGKEPGIDRIYARAKTVGSFLQKANSVVNGVSKYEDPLRQIQDQVAARIITVYLREVDNISNIIERYYRPIEAINLVPESQWQFGYFGKHYVLLMPTDVIEGSDNPDHVPGMFELQIKTVFQHAWSEANHDLGYKPGSTPLDPTAERKLALASAQAWGADQIFQELYSANTE